jgi:hypothetical protein
MCFRTIKILLILLLPFIVTGVIFGEDSIQRLNKEHINANPVWFAFFLNIVLSPLLVYVLIVYQSVLYAVPFVVYYVIVYRFRNKWL